MKNKTTRILLLVILLVAITIGSFYAVNSLDFFSGDKDFFTQEELIEDAEELLEIIEQTHPDPYIRGGGKLAFHRNFQVIINSIPEEGLNRDEFARLLRPFVASVHDGHTLIENPYSINKLQPGGVPLLFNVVEESLYVAGVAGEENKELIGSLLVSVEGVSLEELIERQKKWHGVENNYHAFYLLSAQSLLYYPYLIDILPEWTDFNHINVELQLPSGDIQAFGFNLPVSADSLYMPKSQIQLPVPEDAGFLYDFLDDEKQTAYLRIDYMDEYREMYEKWGDSKAEDYPSVTELFTELVANMKEAGTQTLIVDLRNCVGGNSVMSDILIYFLYGKDTLQYVKGAAYEAGGGSVLKRPPNTKKMAYDFTWDFSDDPGKFEELSPQIPELLDEFAKQMPTFYAEYETGAYAGYYLPDNVVVLVSPKTFSSGFVMTRYFYLAGATLVGTPSGQAVKWFCDPIYLKLNNTQLQLVVSTSYCNHLIPGEPELVEFLPVDHPLIYEKLMSYDFDPNAELLYAMDILP